MRPTNLGFKSPREVVQAPHYNPTLTSKGDRVPFAVPNKKRPKSNQASRFNDSQSQSVNTSIFVGPGKYRDDYNSISNNVKTKILPRYRGEVIDSSSNSYTYAAGSKVLDYAFLSPQAKKLANNFVMMTSIDLTSPKMSTPGTDMLSTNIMTLSTTPQSTKNLESTERKRVHQRSASMAQPPTPGTYAPWERNTPSTHHSPTDHSQKLASVHFKKVVPELTKEQKERNNLIYDQFVDAQLSKELKALKKELEDFQKKKAIKNLYTIESKGVSLQSEGTGHEGHEGEKSMDKESRHIKEPVSVFQFRPNTAQENRNPYIFINEDESRYHISEQPFGQYFKEKSHQSQSQSISQSHSQSQHQHSEGNRTESEEKSSLKGHEREMQDAGILVESSSVNKGGLNENDVSFDQGKSGNVGMSPVNSVNLGVYKVKGSAKEIGKVIDQKAVKKTIESKRQSKANGNNATSYYSISYGISNNKSSKNIAVKGTRKV